MNLQVTHRHFQWLLIFLIHVFKQTFLLNFIIILERVRTGKQTRQFYSLQAATVSLSLVARNNANACWGHLKLNPWLITGFIDAELIRIFYIFENKKIKTRFSGSSIFSIASHKKILILRSTIIVLPNTFWGSTEATQLPLQNPNSLHSFSYEVDWGPNGGGYRWARNYSTLHSMERRSVDDFSRRS